MIVLLIIAIPFFLGLTLFGVRSAATARGLSLLGSLGVFVLTLLSLTVCKNSPALLGWDSSWLPALGSRFTLELDGMGHLLVLLTALAFPLILVATWSTTYTTAHQFYAWMLLAEAGLLGVFMATDALLFYFFWELALIPAYFLCSIWGGEKRIAVTLKFFLYTFLGSLLMLVGIIYLYVHTQDQSFALDSFYKLRLTVEQQSTLFWLFMIAFAIKIPLFPFHTWQPDTYQQAPTATTMVLSGLMVKMGVFGLIRWLAPVLPAGVWSWGDSVSFLAMFGMIYASFLAIRQDDLKKLVAYTSIVHMSLMCLAVFSTTSAGMQGTMMQMFNHGINVIGMWMVVEMIERQTGVRTMSGLGGLARKAPVLTILFVVIALANIALPLTNAFVGEFLMFTGVYLSNVSTFNYIYVAVSGISIILSAVVMLGMIQKVFWGNPAAASESLREVKKHEQLALCIVVVLILVFGVYPQPLLNLTESTATSILSHMITKHP